ncbi:B3 domain-containing protein [Scenedesmus sp. PABB004]|nr:B3 domain-containing protein [Scenedesmus sp. PABB004]
MAAPAGVSAAGLSSFERDRAARIAANAARMAALMGGLQTDLLAKPEKRPRAPVVQRKRGGGGPRLAAEKRRSGRLINMPAPLYYIKDDPTDLRRAPRVPGARSGGGGQRCNGVGGGAPRSTDPYLVAPKGWKPECGSASFAAAEAATDAALALQRRLVEAGRPAFVKLMSASQVAGGFWMQLPLDLVPHYGTGPKRGITLHCADKADAPPDTFFYARPGSSTAWPVMYLPKGDGGGSGLSGGWRGFAIDQRIHPNDTVVLEVLDAPPPPPRAAAASAAAGGAEAGGDAGAAAGAPPAAAAPAEAGAGAASEGAGEAGGARVAPHRRAHLAAHIFRATRYEAEGSQLSGASAHSAAGSQAGSDDVASPQADAPLAQRRAAAAQRVAASSAAAPGSPAADAERGGGRDQDAPPRGRKRVLRDDGELMAAAEAGQLRVKIARQEPSGQAAAAAAPPSPPAPARARKARRRAAAAAAGERAAAAAPPSPPAPPRAGKPPRKGRDQQQQRPRGGGERPRKRAAAGGAARRGALVPQPVDPSQLVPPPTEDEVARDAAGGEFAVECLMAHRVGAGGADEFLVRWEGFGAFWDSWEGLASLDAPPASYPWAGGRAAVPAKFRSAAA